MDVTNYVDGIILWAVTGVLGLVLGWVGKGLVSRRGQRGALETQRTGRKLPQGYPGTLSYNGATIGTVSDVQVVVDEVSAPSTLPDHLGGAQRFEAMRKRAAVLEGELTKVCERLSTMTAERNAACRGYANATTTVNLDADVRKALDNGCTHFQPGGGILVQDLIPEIRRLAEERDRLKNGEALKESAAELARMRSSFQDNLNMFRERSVAHQREKTELEAALKKATAARDAARQGEEHLAGQLNETQAELKKLRAEFSAYIDAAKREVPDDFKVSGQPLADSVKELVEDWTELRKDRDELRAIPAAQPQTATAVIVALMRECQLHDQEYKHQTNAEAMNRAMAFVHASLSHQEDRS